MAGSNSAAVRITLEIIHASPVQGFVDQPND
jgi:hypothetical protein